MICQLYYSLFGCVYTEVQFHEISLILENHDFTMRLSKKTNFLLGLIPSTLNQSRASKRSANH